MAQSEWMRIILWVYVKNSATRFALFTVNLQRNFMASKRDRIILANYGMAQDQPMGARAPFYVLNYVHHPGFQWPQVKLPDRSIAIHQLQ